MKYYRILVSLLVVLPLLTACNEDDDNPTKTTPTSNYRPVKAVAYSPDSTESIEIMYSYNGEQLSEIVYVTSGSESISDSTVMTIKYSNNKVSTLELDGMPYWSFDYDAGGKLIKSWQSNDPEEYMTYSYNGNLLMEVVRNVENYYSEEYIPITDKYTYAAGKVVEVASQLDETVMANIDYVDWDLNRYVYSYTGANVTEVKEYEYDSETEAVDMLYEVTSISYDDKDRVVLLTGTEGVEISMEYNENYMVGASYTEDTDAIVFEYEWENKKSNIYEVSALFMSDAHYVDFISDDLNLFMASFLYFMY